VGAAQEVRVTEIVIVSTANQNALLATFAEGGLLKRSAGRQLDGLTVSRRGTRARPDCVVV